MTHPRYKPRTMDRRPRTLLRERPAPVITAPVIPGHDLLAPPSNFLAPQSLLAPAALLGKPLLAPETPQAATELLRAPSGGLLRKPRGARGTREIREVVRRSVILPTFGHRRHQKVSRWVLPYGHICDFLEQYWGNFTYVPGMGEDFRELAMEQATFDWYNQSYGEIAEDSLEVCEEVGDGFCVKHEDLDGEVQHLHPVAAWRIESRESPLQQVDMCMITEGAVWKHETHDRWPALYEQIVADRRRIMAAPHRIFSDRLRSIDLAVNVLKNAGYELPHALIAGDTVVELVLANLDHDESLWNSLADLTVMEGLHLLDGYDVLDSILKEINGDEARIVNPDELTFLTFTEDQLEASKMIGSGSGVFLDGSYTAIDATYYSLFDQDLDTDRYPWVTGWREIQMKKD